MSPAGVEPATYALGGRRAIQLCHGDVKHIITIILLKVLVFDIVGHLFGKHCKLLSGLTERGLHPFGFSTLSLLPDYD